MAAAIGIQPDSHSPVLGKDSEIRIAVMVQVGRDKRYHTFRVIEHLDPATRDADDDSSRRGR
jgi:hypothetical protein